MLAMRSPPGREVRDHGLDVLAHRTAAGSTLALELLAELIDEPGWPGPRGSCSSVCGPGGPSGCGLPGRTATA